ncbi:MAG: LamG-like jellyroll fold domain-containing protein [Verrucomicrobiota bacterium]
MKTSSIDASLVLALVLSGVGFHPTQSAAGVEGFTTNLPAGLSAIPTVRAVAAPAQVIAAVPSSLPASNGPAIADLGVGASSVVLREIRLLKDGAVADYGLQKVLFPADIAESPLTILTPDGRKLACRAAFLALHDSASGQSFLLGEVRSSIGQLVGDNTVVYPDAFDTVRADVRYRYTGHSLEQDIILCEAVKLPGGFESGNARLEVWSEWVDSAPDARESLTLDLRPGAAGGVAVADEQLKFGAMRIGDGHAFGLQSEGDRTPVAKTFARIEGRDWLIERVDYTALKSALDKLPRPQAGLSPDRLKSDRSGLVRSLQARSGARPAGRIKRMAAVQPPDRDGLVLDFVIVSSVPLPAGVVSWWPAGGNANDAIIASGNNGTWVGAAAYTAGKVGQGFSFNGNNHLSVAHSASLSPTTGLTIEGWVWTPSGASGTRIIAFKGSFTNGEIQYAFYLDDPNLVYAQVEASYYAVSGSGLAAEAWNHVAMTYDTAGKTLTLFINGQPETPVTIADGLVPTPEPLRIGNSGDGNDPYPFVGQMDELTLYNRALAGSEVQSIYNAGAAGKNNPNCATAPADIVAWWPGDGNGYDLARTNHATLSGATYVSAVASQGFNFDGLNDGVAAANDNALNLATATDQLTLEAWIKPLANNNTYGVMSVVGKRYSPNSSTATGYELFLVNGVPGFQIANASGVANFIATGDLRDGGWHHVAVTLDRASTTGGTIYVDGTPRLTFNPTVIAGSLSNAVPVRIGTHPQPGFNGWYKGVIDEVTFYRRALTNIEITALYSAGSAGKCKVDTDGDGLTDLQEAFLGTNPNLADTDGDGMDDGWEWDHFGSFGRGGSGDYDSDGVSDLDEYTAGSDPNTITFETHYPNLNVSNRTVTGSCATATGVPAQMTVLVNSTNWPAAVWSPYNSNFTVTLPNQDSNHMVLVALRGRARDATVVWDETEITLDRCRRYWSSPIRPRSTVSKPYLQLQGYANEALATLTYDLTNAVWLGDQ